MAVTEGQHTGEFLVSEQDDYRSREAGVLLSGQSLAAGAVLGKITTATATSAALGTNVGNGAMGAITISAGAIAGDYRLVIIEPATNLGNFIVEDPAGRIIGHGTVGTAFSAGGLAFTLADGATDFVGGDTLTITVAAGSLKVRAIDFASAVGADVAVGILYDTVDASAADKACVVVLRSCRVNAAELVWPAGASTNQKNAAIAQLKLLGVLAS